MANDQPPEGARITRRDLAKGFCRVTGEEHRIVLQHFEGHVLDIEDTHFHLDSAVMLPDCSADDPVADPADAGRVTGLATLCAVYQHAEAHPQRVALVVGHTDRSGPEKYNLELSELRGANVLALLEGNRQPWVDICQRKHRVEDYQTILKWVHRTWGWGCDPGTVDNVLGSRTRGATEAFQRLYDSGAADLPPGFGASITVDGIVGPQTWGAFFDVYTGVLEQLLGTDSAGLDARRKSLQFIDPRKTVGCGEYHPLTDNVVANRISQIDRRVEILFFDPGEEPRLDCHPSPSVCVKDECDLYDRRCYRLRPIQPKPKPVPVVDFDLLHIHLDADRDGEVDDDWKENASWEAGAGKKGAVILCNNDDDSGKKPGDIWDHKGGLPPELVDNSNSEVDTDADLSDIAPLVLRWELKGERYPEGSWYLSVDDRTKIRIFDKRAPDGTEVVGPSTGKRYRIPDVTPVEGEWTFGVEATRYPDGEFDGLITITLQLEDLAGNTMYEEEARVRVAPWMMCHHLDPTEEVYVVETGDNAVFRTDLGDALTASGTGVGLTELGQKRYGGDRWMQDVMEIGHSSLPLPGRTQRWHLPVVLRTAALRGHNTDLYPLWELLGHDFGYVEAVQPRERERNSLDSHGNLECSPPVTVGGKEYKFGRIIYGGTVDKTRAIFGNASREMVGKVQGFLDAQKVQAPIKVGIDWLYVGHVDEVVSFCPMLNAHKGFKVLLASPARAREILEQDCQGGSFPRLGLSVQELLDVDRLRGVQDHAQSMINDIEAVLKKELGLDEDDFIRLPVLFKEHPAPATIGDPPRRLLALLPDVVNMLVVTRCDGTAHLCIPKPFGPMVGGKCQFERAIEEVLTPPSMDTGVTLNYIDDFDSYHVNQGSVHCGTNSKRNPSTRLDRVLGRLAPQRWWEQDGI